MSDKRACLAIQALILFVIHSSHRHQCSPTHKVTKENRKIQHCTRGYESNSYEYVWHTVTGDNGLKWIEDVRNLASRPASASLGHIPETPCNWAMLGSDRPKAKEGLVNTQTSTVVFKCT